MESVEMDSLDYRDMSVMVTWVIRQEWAADMKFTDAAKVMGVSEEELISIIEGDSDYTPSDDAQGRLNAVGTVDKDAWELDYVEAV